MIQSSSSSPITSLAGSNSLSRATVYIAEDDADLRDALRRVLESTGYNVVASASGAALLVNYDIERVGCLLLDLHLPDMTGLELRERLWTQGCRRPFIVLSGHADVGAAIAAMRLGAVDFFEKPFINEQLLNAVFRGVEQHRMCRRVQCFLDSLTDREHQILRQVVAGRATKEIARELQLSPRTIDVHRSNILRKTGMGSFTQLAHVLARHDPAGV